MKVKIPSEIFTQHPPLGEWSILLGYRGSLAHGMFIPSTDPNSIDDIDLMGVCVPPIDYYFGLHAAFPKNQFFPANGTREIKQGEWDIVIYDARKFIRLLAQGNPNVLAMLWLEKEHYLQVNEAGSLIL